MQDVEEHQRIELEQLGKDYEVVWSDIPLHTNEEATGPYTCSGYVVFSKKIIYSVLIIKKSGTSIVLHRNMKIMIITHSVGHMIGCQKI